MRGASAVAVGSREFQICTTLTSLADTLQCIGCLPNNEYQDDDEQTAEVFLTPKLLWYKGVVFVAPP